MFQGYVQMLLVLWTFHIIKPESALAFISRQNNFSGPYIFLLSPPPSFLPRDVGREEGVGQLECSWGSPQFERQHNLH